MWHTYLQPATLDEALDALAHHAAGARIVAGGTDVMVELSRGVRPTAALIDITRIRELSYVRGDGDTIRLGALATHNDVVASADCRRDIRPLAQACWEVGAPQIRTRATVAGNLVTASPANDTITPLVALDAVLALASRAGERVVPLRDFYHGVRRTSLRPDELVREIRVPRLSARQHGLFIKLGLRRAQAISVVNVACVLTFDGPRVRDARIALGCVAPTVVRATGAEAYLRGKTIDGASCAEAGRIAAAEVAPIDDVRGSAAYRLATLAALVADGLRRLTAGVEAGERTTTLDAPDGRLTETPVLLETAVALPPREPFAGTITTTINGQPYRLAGAQRKSLLDALREDAGLTGTKEGCAEGECGACTVWLDGQAVMACLVPAPQAHGAKVTTIEGLARGERLHPLQEAFIAHGAVQCGYCIPGMLMAGAKLLEERARPARADVRVALSGNICRCTGYRKILDAVQEAGGADDRGTDVPPAPLVPHTRRRHTTTPTSPDETQAGGGER